MDRFDLGEFAGLAGLVVFSLFVWPPLAILTGSVLLLLETNLRSRGRAPVRGVTPSLGVRVRAAVRALRTPPVDGEVAA